MINASWPSEIRDPQRRSDCLRTNCHSDLAAIARSAGIVARLVIRSGIHAHIACMRDVCVCVYGRTNTSTRDVKTAEMLREMRVPSIALPRFRRLPFSFSHSLSAVFKPVHLFRKKESRGVVKVWGCMHICVCRAEHTIREFSNASKVEAASQI